MRLFALFGALLVAGGVYLLVEGGIRLSRTVSRDALSLRVWSADFWLLRPEAPAAGLAPNGQWLVRVAGGLAGLALGGRIVRIATR